MSNETSIFDIIGPIIIGPSSSHTAGAVKIGLLAKKIFGETPQKVKIKLYNSFAKTGKGHGTDKGLLAGLLGMGVSDERIVSAFKIAKEQNLQYEFQYFDDFSKHPNFVEIESLNPSKIKVEGKSIGGGNVIITNINDYAVDIRGDYHTLILVYKDRPGMVYKVSNLINQEKINIASLTCNRTNKGEEASMCICLDSVLNNSVLEKLQKLEDIFITRYIEALEK